MTSRRARLVAVAMLPCLLADAADLRSEQPASRDGRRLELAQAKRSGQRLPDPEAVTGGGIPVMEGPCSASYHTALQVVRDGPATLLTPSVRTARTPDPALPGRWISWPPRTKPLRSSRSPSPGEGDGVCVEQVTKGGRSRCIKWGAKPAPALAQPAVEPTPEEIAVLRGLESFVETRGVAPEFAANGRFDWLSRKLAADLRSYLGQPNHPALCQGAPEMLDFYAGQLNGLRKRVQETAALAERARAMAERRLEASRGGAASSVSVATPEALSDAVLAAVSRVLTPDQITALTHPTDATEPVKTGPMSGLPRPLALLRRAGEVLPGEASEVAPDEQRQSAIAALRTIEMAFYAALLRDRMQSVETAILGTIGAIRQTHAGQCSCRP